MNIAAALRRFLPALLLVGTLPAATAQITLTADDLPYQVGTNDFAQRFTENEDGSNTAALAALIAQAGANQTYDFTPVVFEGLIEGEIEVTSGATGPGASESPLDRATITALFPLEAEEDGMTLEGEIYFYQEVMADALFNLGSHFEGESDGVPVDFTLRNTPGGARESVFPLAFGATWSTSYTQEGLFSSMIQADYEVDGWGTLTGPDSPAVPVLRVKCTTDLTTFGITATTVSYEFRTQANVFAVITEGGFSQPLTASLTTTGPVTPTAAEEDTEGGAFALGLPRPHPIASQAVLGYRLPSPQRVRLAVYDLLGREVAVLVDGTRQAGHHEVVVDARALPSGVYLYRLEAGPHRQTRRLTVVR